MTRFYIEGADEFDRACRLLDKRDGAFLENEAPSTIWCHPQNSCLLSLRGITGDDQIAQWDTRFDAKGKKVLDDAE